VRINKFSLPFLAFLQATGLLIYVSLISLFMLSANQIFGNFPNFFGPIAFLLLFVISATISALLVLGRTGFLFWEKRYKESFSLAFWTLGWLIFYLATVFIYLFLCM
jgi:hypothetical protein